MTTTSLPAYDVNSFVTFPGLTHQIALGGDGIDDALEAANREFFLLFNDPMEEGKFYPYAAKMRVEKMVRLPDGVWSLRALCLVGARLKTTTSRGDQIFATAELLEEPAPCKDVMNEEEKKTIIAHLQNAYPAILDTKRVGVEDENSVRNRLSKARLTDQFLAHLGLIVGSPYRDDGIPGFAFRPSSLSAAERKAWNAKMTRRIAILGETNPQQRLAMFRDILADEGQS